MKLYNTNTNLIKVIERVYRKAISAVFYNGSVVEWFSTTVGVRQGRLLNIFLERIMADALGLKGLDKKFHTELHSILYTK